MKRIYFAVLVSCILFLTSCTPTTDLSEQRDHISDQAGILNSNMVSELTVFAGEIYDKTGIEMVVVTMDEVKASLEDICDEMFQERARTDEEKYADTIVLFIDVRKKEACIRNTPALDTIITTDRKNVIIKVLMNPLLEEKKFSQAAGSGFMALAKILRDELKADIRPVYNLRAGE